MILHSFLLWIRPFVLLFRFLLTKANILIGIFTKGSPQTSSNYKRFINVCGMKWLEEHNSWFFILDFRISPLFSMISQCDFSIWPAELNWNWWTLSKPAFITFCEISLQYILRFHGNKFWYLIEIYFEISLKYIMTFRLILWD